MLRSYYQKKLTDSNFINHKRAKSKQELDNEYIQHCILVNKQKKFRTSKEKDRNTMLKRCQQCLGFSDGKYFVYCQFCQDAYHSYCLEKKYHLSYKSKNKECIVCPKCKEEQKTMDNFFPKVEKEKEKKVNISTISGETKLNCFKCHKKIFTKQDGRKCEKCKQTFHKHCFKNEDPKIVCSDCENTISNKIKETKISDYFKTQKMNNASRGKEKEIEEKINKTDFPLLIKIRDQLEDDPKARPKKKIEGHLRLPKQLNETQKKVMMESLFRALEVKKISFNDDLVFIDPDCPKEMNNAKVEVSLVELSDYNKKIYYSFKERSRKGIYAPIEVIDDPIQRFVVKAIDEIPLNTLICEYTGEVTNLRKKLFDKNDSIMELIRAPSSDASIVICPEKYGNLARFISGVNNHDPVLKKKQNIYSIKTAIDGTAHILLISSRCIKKGEVLYYDYNGVYNNYPTEKFV